MAKKKFGFISVMMASVLALTACGGSDSSSSSEGGSSEETYVLQAGHSLPDDHPYHIGFLEMAEAVEERTDGQVTIEVFANSEIGAERELTEGMGLGTVDLVVSSTAPVTNFVPELGVLDVPFLFQDRESAVEILEGDIGDELFAKME